MGLFSNRCSCGPGYTHRGVFETEFQHKFGLRRHVAQYVTDTVAKPCSLLTQAEVESALGKGATMTHYANPRTGMNECKLKPAVGSDLDELVIVVHETTPESWLMVKKGYMEDKRVKQVRHLGDDAINVGGYAGIWARKGDKYVQVFGSLKPERDEKAELFLLEKALSRL